MRYNVNACSSVIGHAKHWRKKFIFWSSCTHLVTKSSEEWNLKRNAKV